jgi:hypothetical protein
MIYDIIYLTVIGLPPGGNSTIHICTQTIHRTTQSTQTIQRTTQFAPEKETTRSGRFARGKKGTLSIEGCVGHRARLDV